MNKTEFQKVLIENNISQKGLATKMGKSPNTISSWVNGKAYPSTKDVSEMCSILNIEDDNRKALIFLD